MNGARRGRKRQTPDFVVERIVRERNAGVPWRQIARRLNEDGIPLPAGGREWQTGRIQSIYERAQRDRLETTTSEALEVERS